jgi:hypothetical protein
MEKDNNQFRDPTKKVRLIDAEQAKRATYEEIFWTESEQAVVRNFLAKLPKVDAVEVPCKIGDFVWAIRSFKGHKHPQRGIVSDMFFTRNMKLQIVVKYVARGEWGKTVFATDKDAYAAIGVSPCPNCGAKMDGERKDNGD